MEVFGLSVLVLMENAGRGCTDWLLNDGVEGRVVICCGKGNNGGDGLVIARHLEAAGVEMPRWCCSRNRMNCRAMLSWELSNTADTAMCMRTLAMAVQSGRRPKIFNTDQGSPFTSEEWTKEIESNGIKVSVGGKGALDG